MSDRQADNFFMSTPMSLSPDEHEQTDVSAMEPAQSRAPYGMAAVMFGMCTLPVALWYLLRWEPWSRLLDSWQFITLLDIPIIVTAAAYYLMMSARPRLPLLGMAILAAELGMLYSLPGRDVMFTFWTSPDQFFSFLAWVILAGIVGLLIGRSFSVERRPQLVIALSFLFMFVFVGLRDLLA